MQDILASAVERMRSKGAQFCDARWQSIEKTMVVVVDGGVRTLSDDRSAGVCLRARIDGSWGYASVIDPSSESVLDASIRAVRSARSGTATGKAIPNRKALQAKVRAPVKVHPSQIPLEEKLSIVFDLDKAQKVGPQVVNTNSMYREEVRNNILCNSLGDELEWEEVRLRLIGQTITSDGTATEMYYDGIDGSAGFEMVKGSDVMALGRRIGDEAVKMLRAKRAPSGAVTCISDPMISGLLAHEVMGHASEADEIVKRRSFLTDAVGKKVASEQITMVDDGTFPGAHGYIPFDDEGTPSSRTKIIENGVYRGYMQTLETAAEMGVDPTGNGRAQDYGRRVWVRMTNTFFEKGDMKLEEMLEGVKFGVLCDKMVSGMEDPVGGGFEAKALRGHLIENGEMTTMLRSFTLTGKALDILRTVDAVGDKVELDGGNCGKGIEDWVPVSSGGPYCRSTIVLGGG
jgi:TldD protein